MKKLVLFSFAVMVCVSAFAQLHPEHKRANNWIFGSKVLGSIRFNFNNPMSMSYTTGMTSQGYSCTTISDVNGNLMFHCNSQSVYNKDYQNIGGVIIGQESTKGNLFVPVPGSDSLLLLFHSSSVWDFSYQYGLEYSMINTNGNSGAGGFVFQNTHLLPVNAGSVAACCHKNQKDYWVIAADTNGIMYSWLIDSTGIPQLKHSTPIITVRTVFNTPISRIIMVFTPRPEADLIGIVTQDIEGGLITDYTLSVLKFDNETGHFGTELLLESHAGQLQTGDYFPTVLSFSPSGKWLYVPFVETPVPRNGYIQRYTNLYEAISVNDVYSETVFTSVNYDCPATIQCTPLGNMVFWKSSATNPGSMTTPYVSFIQYPDSSQPVLLLDAVNAGANTFTWAPLNNLPWQWYYRPEGFLNVPVNNTEPLIIAPNPVNDVLYLLNCEQNIIRAEMHDISGRVLHPRFNSTGEVYTDNLNNGIYLLKIEFSGGFVKTAKVMVQH